MRICEVENVTKNTQNCDPSDPFLKHKMHQNSSSAQTSVLDSLGELTTLHPEPLIGWGGGRSFPIFLMCKAFGVSVSTPRLTVANATSF